MPYAWLFLILTPGNKGLLAQEQAAPTDYLQPTPPCYMTYYQQQFYALRARLYPHPQVGAQLRRARQLIDQHFADDLDLPRLAAVACYSPFHFLRQFRRYYGVTPYAYLRQVRLTYAKRALVAGLNARQACFAAGFNSVSSFTTLFRQQVGCPPAAFQRRHQLRNFQEVSPLLKGRTCGPVSFVSHGPTYPPNQHHRC